MVISAVDPQVLLEILGREKVVLMPYSEYEALMSQLEDLEDVRDMLEAEAEYRAGQGRPLREFLAEHEGAFDLSG